MTPPQRKQQLDDLYRMSCMDDAVVLLWALRVCEECEPWQWGQVIEDRGGPSRSKVSATLRRLRVEGF